MAVSLVLLAGSGAGAARQASLIDTLLTSYRDGDPDFFRRSFPDQQSFRSAVDYLVEHARRQPRVWEPSRAGLFLELAVRATERPWPSGSRLLMAGMRIVIGRPDSPGENPAADRFEVVFHHTAVATLVGIADWNTAEAYVDAVADRIGEAGPGRRRLSDPLWPLMVGWVAEARTSPAVDGNPGPDDVPSLIAASGPGRRELDRAEAALRRATTMPQPPAEALVRHAFVLHRLRRDREAAELLTRTSAAGLTADRVLRYWYGLIAGRVHEALGDVAAAERAYVDASETWPAAQTARIALASLLERHSRTAEAEQWIARVWQLPAGATDPWWFYWSGDRERIAAGLRELRRARP